MDYLRRGIELAREAGDADGETFLRMSLISLMLRKSLVSEAAAELDRIVLKRGDRSDSPARYAAFALELGRGEDALNALRMGFEDECLSDLTLGDAEEYKWRRMRLVEYSHRVGWTAFKTEVSKLASDLFQGVQLPLREVAPLKDDLLKVVREEPFSLPYAALERHLMTLDLS